jgi:hypothetical protein
MEKSDLRFPFAGRVVGLRLTPYLSVLPSTYSEPGRREAPPLVLLEFG